MNKANDHGQVKGGATEVKPQPAKAGNGLSGAPSSPKPYPREATWYEPIVNCDMGRES